MSRLLRGTRTLLHLAVGFATLLVFLYLGEALTRLSGTPVPGSVFGMVLLAVALRLRLLPLALLQPAAGVLLRHMALFFVPPGVGLLLYLDLLRAQWLAIAAATVVGSVAVLLVVGGVQQRMERRG